MGGIRGRCVLCLALPDTWALGQVRCSEASYNLGPSPQKEEARRGFVCLRSPLWGTEAGGGGLSRRTPCLAGVEGSAPLPGPSPFPAPRLPVPPRRPRRLRPCRRATRVRFPRLGATVLPSGPPSSRAALSQSRPPRPRFPLPNTVARTGTGARARTCLWGTVRPLAGARGVTVGGVVSSGVGVLWACLCSVTLLSTDSCAWERGTCRTCLVSAGPESGGTLGSMRLERPPQARLTRVRQPHSRNASPRRVLRSGRRGPLGGPGWPWAVLVFEGARGAGDSTRRHL